MLNNMIHKIGEKGRDDPGVFDDAKDYVFRAMELDAFPGLLNLGRPLFRVFKRSNLSSTLKGVLARPGRLGAV